MPNRPDHAHAAAPRDFHRPKVALVEDDPHLREVLAVNLDDAGFDVIACASAEAFWRERAHTPFDLVVLDLTLPGEGGLSVLRRLRATSGVGVVVLTGRTLPADHAQSLTEGADAFLSKPVDLQVLAATLRSVVRRMQPVAPAIAWRLTGDGWSLCAPDGGIVELSVQERLLLEGVMEEPGRVVTREALLERFDRANEEVDPQRLDMVVHRLRKKVAQLGRRLPLRTLYRSGYVFQADATSA
ncbi:response regulator transcription factor [Lysobacter auxotrophicus]|uniref:Response regulator transcription factor n=1 Tax=Lysobacter auxotrophicus TaxID=2992573 RepID=A0ABM8D9H5_9GAMM|nr:response regulator transcription factor [Lysobacter auxotrophicus]BDU15171.1 response regulator transcription factor [Lysobacter auxotrophicus]